MSGEWSDQLEKRNRGEVDGYYGMGENLEPAPEPVRDEVTHVAEATAAADTPAKPRARKTTAKKSTAKKSTPRRAAKKSTAKK